MFNTRFNRKPSAGVTSSAPSLTQQQFKETQSITSLIRRALTGDQSVFRQPKYLDVLSAPESYHDAVSKQALANSIWHDMPDSVKATYGSPEALVNDFDNEVAKVLAEREKGENPPSTVSNETTTSTTNVTDSTAKTA